MTHSRPTLPDPGHEPLVPVIAEWESVEARIAAWSRWADDEKALPDEALDAALVRLLEEIRHSL